MKHFEEVWEAAEKVAEETYKDIAWDDFLNKMQNVFKKIQDGDSDRMHVQLGELLFLTCLLSKKFNVNTFIALQQATLDNKVDMLEPDQ